MVPSASLNFSHEDRTSADRSSPHYYTVCLRIKHDLREKEGEWHEVGKGGMISEIAQKR